MSKAYALSGARVAYMTGPNDVNMDIVQMYTPPWSVSYVAQVAAVSALDDIKYYTEKWNETRHLRKRMTDCIPGSVEGVCNFILVPCKNPDELVKLAASENIYIRSIDGALRIAVRSTHENARVLKFLSDYL